jgi:hypothetical protein
MRGTGTNCGAQKQRIAESNTTRNITGWKKTLGLRTISGKILVSKDLAVPKREICDR